jgi:hypothetical protein
MLSRPSFSKLGLRLFLSERSTATYPRADRPKLFLPAAVDGSPSLQATSGSINP